MDIQHHVILRYYKVLASSMLMPDSFPEQVVTAMKVQVGRSWMYDHWRGSGQLDSISASPTSHEAALAITELVLRHSIEQ